MSFLVSPADLPDAVPPGELVALAYPAEVAAVGAAVRRRLPCLVECPKEVAPYVAPAVRAHVRSHNLTCTLIDGRVAPPSSGFVGSMRQALLDVVRRPHADTVVVLPHLDLLAGGPDPTHAAGELAALLTENPDLIWVGFKAPGTTLPRVVEQLPLCRVRIGGVPADRLRCLVTQREGRKFGPAVDLARLHRCVAGLNVVQLRKYLATLDREDLPANPDGAFAELRRLTLPFGLAVPAETLDSVGGYPLAKRRLRDEVLDVVARADAAAPADRGRVGRLAPRGVLLAGPPGVGKRHFARAAANALGAVYLEATGSDLRSRSAGGAGRTLRQLFATARQAAPAVVLLNDLDLLATRPVGGTPGQSLFFPLLHELDSLSWGEFVLAVGTARTTAGIDPELIQPGRLEVVIELGPPTAEYRAEILRRAAEAVGLTLAEDAAARATDLSATAPPVPPFHAARLSALCRGLARLRLRTGRDGPVTADEVAEVWGRM